MILVVAHDAGGAEILSSYVRQKKLDCIYSLSGPALKIFQQKLGPIKIMPLEEAIIDCDWLLCGTGWQSDFEWLAIRMAKTYHKKVVVFIDHWIYYKERFVKNNIACLPDEICVGDVAAQHMAVKEFPEILVQLVPNPHFADLQEVFSRIVYPPSGSFERKKNNPSILYVCEPLAEDEKRYERYRRYTEHDALRYFLSHLEEINIMPDRIAIRPHPAEKDDKYCWVLDEFNLPVIITREKSLLDSVIDSDVVAGCESMAMVIALLAGKRVISSIPPEGGYCILPYKEIEHLHQLLNVVDVKE